MLEGDEDGWAETLGDTNGEVQSPVNGRHEDRVRGALLKLGSLEGDEGVWTEIQSDADGEVEGLVDG